jgi:hypothetical protein
MKLIVVTPAGRKRYLRLLAHHVLSSPEVDEWHLWANCRTAEDRTYLEDLAASDPRCRIKRLPQADGGWAVIGEFFRFCDDSDAFYVRLDDDIVYLEQDFFPRFLARARADTSNAFWFSPVVINNGVCNWLLKYFSRVAIRGPVSGQAMCPYTWRHPEFPIALHPVFMEAVRSNRLDLFRIPDTDHRLARFSINAVGFFGRDKQALGEQFYAPEGNEEEWLSACLPALTGRHGRIFGDLTAAHYSYFPQENGVLQTDILERYAALAGLAPEPYERPAPEEPGYRPSFAVSLDARDLAALPHRDTRRGSPLFDLR